MAKPTTNKQKSWYRVTAAANGSPAEIYIYDVIVNYAWDDDEVTAKGFIDDLKAIGSDTPLDLHINSPGGSVFAGLAIYNALKRHQAEVCVYIDGLAASIASVVAMAGDRIVMPENALLMIHDPYSWAGGTADDLRKAAEMLDKATDSIISTYQAKTEMETEALADMMAAETWINAAKALEWGFADEVEEALPMAALAGKIEAFDLSRYHNVPIKSGTVTNLQPVKPVAVPDLNKPQKIKSIKGDIAMDAKTLKADHQDTYNEIFAAGKDAGIEEGKTAGIDEGKKAGAQAEADRIKAVEAQLIPGHEDLIAELKADGVTTGDQAAAKVLAAEKLVRGKQLGNLQNDTVPHVPGAQDEPDSNQEEKAAVSAMVAGGNKRRR